MATVLISSSVAKFIYVEKGGENKQKDEKDITQSYIGIYPFALLSSSYYAPTDKTTTCIGITGVCCNLSLCNYNILYSFISHGDYLGESGSINRSSYLTHNASIGYNIILSDSIGLRPNVGYYRYSISEYNDLENSILVGCDTLFYLGNDGYYSISPVIGYNGTTFTYGFGVSGTVFSSDFITIYGNIKYEYCDSFRLFTFCASIGTPLHFLD